MSIWHFCRDSTQANESLLDSWHENVISASFTSDLQDAEMLECRWQMQMQLRLPRRVSNFAPLHHPGVSVSILLFTISFVLSRFLRSCNLLTAVVSWGWSADVCCGLNLKMLSWFSSFLIRHCCLVQFKSQTDLVFWIFHLLIMQEPLLHDGLSAARSKTARAAVRRILNCFHFMQNYGVWICQFCLGFGGSRLVSLPRAPSPALRPSRFSRRATAFARKLLRAWLEEFSSCFMRKLWCLEMVNFIEVLEDIGCFGFWDVSMYACPCQFGTDLSLVE